MVGPGRALCRLMGLGGLTVFLLGVPGLRGQSLEDFEKRVTEFTLDNGLHFIVVERHTAPVVSFLTYADVGSVNEVPGITGIAHIFEHMAFKGTDRIGTRDYAAEKAAMDRMDRIFQEIKRERWKGDRADPEKLRRLQAALEAAEKEADRYRVHDEYERVLEREGAVGLNASTSQDATRYYVSLPANKIELWFSLESERFLRPVLREFYKEKKVVMEERRLSENNHIGRLIEDFLATAYKAHPYGQPVVGHMSDLEAITRAEAEAWFRKYYGAANLTIGIVGDVDPGAVRRLAETYFGRLPRGEKPEPVETVEPEQQGPRCCSIVARAQPLVILGYHRPSVNHPDEAVFAAITDIMGRGRTSRLYQRLVKERKIAMAAGAFSGLTGDKYPGLFNFYAFPAKGHTAEENQAAIEEEIERLKTEPVTPEELRRAKTRARADLIRSMRSNMGLAFQLTYYHVVTGDWRNLFRSLERIEAVTAEDILRVARTYFTRKNQTVCKIIPERAS